MDGLRPGPRRRRRILGLAAGAGNAAAKHLARVACQDRSPKRPRDARFWAQNDRFGPDVVTFGEPFPKEPSKNDPKQPTTATSGPNPGSGPEILNLADVVVFLGCFGWVNINFDGFLEVFESSWPPWPQISPNGVPIVQLMFLYEARARARARARASYRNISCTIGNPFGHDWDQEGSKTEGNPSRNDFRHGSPCRLTMF